jgi:hypothetical protein
MGMNELTSTLKMASIRFSHNVPNDRHLKVGDTVYGGISEKSVRNKFYFCQFLQKDVLLFHFNFCPHFISYKTSSYCLNVQETKEKEIKIYFIFS